jgi:FixJ family two-component response regulator
MSSDSQRNTCTFNRIVQQSGTQVKHLPKVFIVDDETAVLKSLDAVLSPHGYEVAYFRSAQEFLAQHHPTQVGCVLIDLLMPGMGGSEVLRHLQDSGSLLSVIIISGLIDPRAFESRETAWITMLEKPYELSTLLTMIEDGIAGSFRRRAERHRSGTI